MENNLYIKISKEESHKLNDFLIGSAVCLNIFFLKKSTLNYG